MDKATQIFFANNIDVYIGHAYRLGCYLTFVDDFDFF